MPNFAKYLKISSHPKHLHQSPTYWIPKTFIQLQDPNSPVPKNNITQIKTNYIIRKVEEKKKKKSVYSTCN